MSHDTTVAAIAKSAGKKTATDIEIVGVANLKPSDIQKGIRIQVYSKWTLTSSRGAKQPTLSFILLDQQGGAIQANAEGRERARFDTSLQINDTYTITGFGLQDTKRYMQTLPNFFTLILGRLTDIHQYTGNGFPLHHFNFASYNDVAQRADNSTTTLTDYIGCVLSVGDIREPKAPSQKQVVWRDIVIRNLERDTVRFTLWNDRAREFDTDAYEKEPKPTVIAVSSCWVKTYGGLQLSSTPATYYYLNPPIPETDYILSMYDQLLPPPVIQNVRAYRYDNIEDEKRRNRVTIDELLREDPRNQTNVRFTVIATVVEIITRREWYFRRCHDCRWKIFHDRPHAHCEIPDPTQPNDYSYCFRLLISDDSGMLTLTCFSNEAHSMVKECNKVILEEGYTNPFVLPPHLTALEGTVHLFQLHYSTESTKENQIFVLDAVMLSGQQLLLPAQAALPADEKLLLTGPESSSAVKKGTTSELPVTPVSAEILQVSTPITVEPAIDLQDQPAKTEAPRTSARRRLFVSDVQQDAANSAKKSKPTVRK